MRKIGRRAQFRKSRGLYAVSTFSFSWSRTLDVRPGGRPERKNGKREDTMAIVMQKRLDVMRRVMEIRGPTFCRYRR